jgi:rhodanese-related sulfurtransferase
MQSWWHCIRGLVGQSRVAELSAADLAHRLADGQAVQLIDIRDAGAFRAGHLPGAHHLPLDRLEQNLGMLERRKLTVVY